MEGAATDDGRRERKSYRRMTELGASEPGSWAGSEIREGIPQQARMHITPSKRWQLNARLRADRAWDLPPVPARSESVRSARASTRTPWLGGHRQVFGRRTRGLRGRIG